MLDSTVTCGDEQDNLRKKTKVGQSDVGQEHTVLYPIALSALSTLARLAGSESNCAPFIPCGFGSGPH